MAIIKKLGFFGAPLVLMTAGALTAAGCDKAKDISEGACGECGEIAAGDIGISGNAKLDGFFAAVATLNKSVVTINGNFELGLKNLEAAFGLKSEGEISARVDDLVAAIETEVSANASAGLTVDAKPAMCSANVNVAVEAQAQCEVKADCDVQPPTSTVECSGSCTGSCTAGCDGKVECKVKAPSITCEGKCEGSCELEASAKCEGSCHGECTGSCSAYAKNAEGNAECAGKCDGECTGSCELSAAATCEGKCTGSCTAEGGEASCEGEVKCEGSCTGKCEGGCTGEVTPPKADCDASADCQAQASAQASASVECTPPSLQVGFEFTGDADAKASFEAKIGALKLNAPTMIAAFTKYTALFDGKVDGKVVFETAPVASVTAGLGTVISAGVNGDLFADIAPGRVGCVLPELNKSVSILGDLTSEAVAGIKAQGKFATAFTGGFSN